MSDIYYKTVWGGTPKEAIWVFTEKEKTFQEKYGLRTDHLMKIESVKIYIEENKKFHFLGEDDEELHLWEIGYSFRRASL